MNILCGLIKSERLHTQAQSCSHQLTRARPASVGGWACKSRRTGVLWEGLPLPYVFDYSSSVLGRYFGNCV